MPPARFEGRLKSWDDDHGFGFIEPTLGGQEIFVHVKAFARRGGGRPRVNELVSFEVELGPRGKKRARNVEPLKKAAAATSRAVRASPAQWGTVTLFAIPAFTLLYLVVAMLWKTPGWVAAAYAVASVVTFAAYALDKAAAAQAASRTPESSLHLLALMGGWPGALLAQQVLRHKSVKAEFRRVFWATVVLNVAGFALLCSPLGASLWALR